MDRTKEWYRELRKPRFAPPAWVFGPVWTVLYLLIAISFGYVFYETYEGIIPIHVAALFVLNILFNVLYTPIQFRLRNLRLASLDILLVLGTLIYALQEVHPYASWVTYINLPYLAWVSFATILQLSITWMNKEKW